MNTIFSGHIFLIDEDLERVKFLKNNLNDINDTIFFNDFTSVKEAFTMVLTNGILAPDYIYIHASLADFEAKKNLKKLRSIYKTKSAEIVVFGNTISKGLIAGALKYNFRIVKTYPETELFECALFDDAFIAKNQKVIYASMQML